VSIKMTLEFGAKQVIEVCLKVRSSEKVFILTDKDTLKVAEALEKAAQQAAREVENDYLEEYGLRPLDSFPEQLKAKVLEADVVIFAAKKVADEKVNEASTLRNPLKQFCIDHKIRYALMMDINEDVMGQSMSADYNEVRELSTKVYDAVKDARTIRITSSIGTDLTIELRNPRWKNTYGDLSSTPQKGFNLPSGEVFGYPENVNGVFIVDGLIGDHFTLKYGETQEFPVKLTIENSRIIDIECSNKELEKELKVYIKSEENADRVGEVGIGTNPGIKDFIGIMLQDEKFPGIHIACGKPCHDTNDEWTASIHCDFLIKNANITVDSVVLMKDGEFEV
jgi:leucyl aminopeptidase (aminopeptidase T)